MPAGKPTPRKPTVRAKDHVPVAKIDPQNPGKVIYEVPLQRREVKAEPQPVIIDSEDYERIVSKGCPRVWYGKPTQSGEYVTIKSFRRGKGDEVRNNAPVAWIILDIWPEHGLQVRYADGDRFNLRRANLVPEPRENNPHVQEARANRKARKAGESEE